MYAFDNITLFDVISYYFLTMAITMRFIIC